MGYTNSETANLTNNTNIPKIKIADDPLCSITNHLFLQCNELLTGLKPACLVTLSDRTDNSGGNFYQIWLQNQQEILPRLNGIQAFLLQTKEHSVLLLCYLTPRMEQHLSQVGIRTLLHKAGYDISMSVDSLLGELKQRIATRNSFPFEIGLFIAYPANLLDYYDDPLDCLTAHLMLECSEVLAGIKPANLLSMVNRARPCGRNLYKIWRSNRNSITARLNKINFIELQTREKSLLLFCYNKKRLEQHLTHSGIRNLLHKAGYKNTASVEELLAELKQRIANNDKFPHEIGLFIGYPAKDVAAFMGLIKLPMTCQGPWKIYGNPDQSLNLAEQFRCCRQKMCSILATGTSKVLELNSPEHPFFCKSADIKYHNHGGIVQ